MDQKGPMTSFIDVLFKFELYMFVLSIDRIPSRLKSIDMIYCAQKGPIGSFIDVLFMFELIYTCYFTRQTPMLIKPMEFVDRANMAQ